MLFLLIGGNGDDDNVDSETDTSIPVDDDDHDIASLVSQPSLSLRPSSLQLCPLAPVRQCACFFLMFPGNLELDALFEDPGVSCAIIQDMLALERAVYRRCAPGQLDRLRTNRQQCARFLTDVVAATVLPLHSADFPLQLMDFTHSWSERRDNDTQIFDVFPLPAGVFFFNQNGSRVGIRTSVSSPTSRSARGSRRNLHQAQVPQRPDVAHSTDNSEVTRAEFRILEVLNYELATPTPAAWIKIFERRQNL